MRDFIDAVNWRGAVIGWALAMLATALLAVADASTEALSAVFGALGAAIVVLVTHRREPEKPRSPRFIREEPRVAAEAEVPVVDVEDGIAVDVVAVDKVERDTNVVTPVALRILAREEKLRRTEARSRPIMSPLTALELEILDLLAEGMTAEEIAERLVVSRAHVGGHVRRILEKLDVSTRAETAALLRPNRPAEES